MNDDRRDLTPAYPFAGRVLCLGEAPLGSGHAHAINTIKTAGGFARLGARTLLLLRPPEASHDRDSLHDDDSLADLLDAYGERGRLDVCCYPGPVYPTDWRDAEAWSLGFAAWAVETARSFRPDAVYARSYLAPVALAEDGFAVVAETHAHPGAVNPMLDALLRAASDAGPIRVVTTIADLLASDYAARGAAPDRFIVTPDGVDIELFAAPPTEPLDLGSGTHVLYAGSLGAGKGVATLLDAAPRLADIGVNIHCVGGDDPHRDTWRDRIRERSLGNVVFHPRVELRDVPRWLHAADILALPNEAEEPASAWTSPVKLGEYLATGKPIIASDIPGVRRWADESALRFFRASDAESLAAAVAAALGEQPDHAERRRAEALRLAQRYSYANRARAMLDALHRTAHAHTDDRPERRQGAARA